MKEHQFVIAVRADDALSTDRVRIVVDSLLKIGLSDATRTVEGGEGSVDAQLALDMSISSPVALEHKVRAAFGMGDIIGIIDNDDVCKDLSDEQIADLAGNFMDRITKDLEEKLTKVGNDFLDEKWLQLRDELLSDIETEDDTSTPSL